MRFRYLFVVALFQLFLTCIHAQSPLFQAVQKGDSVAVKRLLENDPAIDLSDTYSGFQALHFAARDNAVGCARLLLEKGAPVDGRGRVTDRGEWTPLMLAVHNNNFEVAYLLAQAGASWTWTNDQKTSAATLAAQKNNYWTLALKSDPQVAWLKWTAVSYVTKGNLVGLKSLVTLHGLEKINRSISDWALIHFAARDNKRDIVDYLLKAPGQVNLQNNEGATPLILAAINNHAELCDLLLRAGADASIKDNKGRTAVNWAKDFGLNQLLDVLTDPQKGMEGYYRNLKLFDAIRKNDQQAAEKALAAGAILEAIGAFHFSPLATAISLNNLSMIRFLLQKGADGNKAFGSPDYRTNPVLYAAQYGLNDVLLLLARAGANLQAINPKGETALQLAEANKQYWSAQLLKDTLRYYNWKVIQKMRANEGPDTAFQRAWQQNSRNIDLADEVGNTALHTAVALRRPSWIEWLLTTGSAKEVTNHQYQTPQNLAGDKDSSYLPYYFTDFKKAVAYRRFFEAVRANKPQDIRALLEEVDINTRNEWGFTALHMALADLSHQATDLLLSCNANPTLATPDGTTPLAIAAQYQNYQGLLALEKAGVQVTAGEVAGSKSYWIRQHLTNAEGTRKQYQQQQQFWEAVRKGDSLTVGRLLQQKADLTLHNEEGWNALHLAAMYGHKGLVELFLSKGADKDAQTLKTLRTPLQIAAINHQYEVVRTLLFKEADTDIQDKEGQTFSDLDDIKLMELLVEYRQFQNNQLANQLYFIYAERGKLAELKADEQKLPDINMKNAAGETMLSLAVDNGHVELASWLIQKGAQVSMKTGAEANTTLMLAARNGDYPMTRLLVQNKADRQAKNKEGLTAAQLAEKKKYTELSKYLKGNQQAEWNLELYQAVLDKDTAAVRTWLAKGANPNTRDKDSTGFSTLHFASRDGLTRILPLLLQAGAKVNMPAKAGSRWYTPLMLATTNDHFPEAQLLLNKGADPHWKNEVDTSALLIAKAKSPYISLLFSDAQKGAAAYRNEKQLFDLVLAGDTAAIKNLLREGVSVNIKDGSGYSPLHYAVYNNSLMLTQLLVDAKADVNARHAAGYTPLMLAALNQNVDLVSLLLEAGASRTEKTTADSTALSLAQVRGYGGVVDMLLDDGKGKEWKQWRDAVLQNDSVSFKRKIREGLDPNKAIEAGFNILHYAVREGRYDMTAQLLAAGADINQKNDQQWTPLMLAARNGYWKIVYLLLANGADTKAENNEKDDARDLAIAHGHYMVREMIRTPDSIYTHLLLLEAAENKNEAELQKLLRKGVDVNFQNELKVTALHLAVFNDQLTMAETLLRQGADPNKVAQRDAGEVTALMLAAEKNNPHLVKLLLDYGADKTKKLGTATALSVAQSANAYWCAEILKDPTAGFKRYGVSVKLQEAIRNDDVFDLQDAVLNGASLEEPVFSDLRPLHYAVRQSSKAAIDYLVRLGVDTKAETKFGWTPFMVAAGNNLVDIGWQLLSHRIDPQYRNSEGKNAADIARENEAEDFVAFLKQPAVYWAQLQLLKAVQKNDAAAVRNLLASGVKPGEQAVGASPLVVAVKNRFTSLVKMLLEAGASPNARDADQKACLLLATEMEAVDNDQFHLESFKIFDLLVQHRALVNDVDKDHHALDHYLKSHPLGWYSKRLANKTTLQPVVQAERLVQAIRQKDEAGWQALLAAGGPVNAQDASGQSLLTWCIKNNHREAALALLVGGAKPVAPYLQAPMAAEITSGNTSLLEPLQKNGFSVNGRTEDGTTMLVLALKFSNTKAALKLVELGADVNQADANGYRPLEAAASNGWNVEALPLLLKKGADPNKPSGPRLTYPLIEATDSAAIAVLLQYKAKPNVQDKDGNSPLLQAIAESTEVSWQVSTSSSTVKTVYTNNAPLQKIQQLLKAGANPNAVRALPGGSQSCLMAAVEKDNMIAALTLLDAGADMEWKNEKGLSAYSIAKASGNARMLRLVLDPEKARKDFALRAAFMAGDTLQAIQLIKGGADINHQDANGNTVLHAAFNQVDSTSPARIGFLLQQGARMDLFNKDGESPLDRAIDKHSNTSSYKDQCQEIISRMLALGADPNKPNANKQYPLQRAVENSDIRLAYTLVKAGARPGNKNVHGETALDMARKKGNQVMTEVLEGRFDPRGKKLYDDWVRELKAIPIDTKGNPQEVYLSEKTLDAAAREYPKTAYAYQSALRDYIYTLAFNGQVTAALASAEAYTSQLKLENTNSKEYRESYLLQEALYRTSGNRKRAIEVTKTAISLMNKNGAEKMEAYHTLANLYEDSTAARYFQLALAEADHEPSAETDALKVKIDYASYLIDQKDTAARQLLQEVEQQVDKKAGSADKSVDAYLLRDLYSERIKLERTLGSKQTALAYLHKMLAIKDTMAIASSGGYQALLLDQFDIAENLLQKAKAGANSALAARKNLLQLYLKTGQVQKVVAAAGELNNSLMNTLGKEFRFLSEEEKYNLLLQNKIYFDLLYSAAWKYPNEKQLVRIAYNNALFAKGALMRSNSTLKIEVENNSSEVVKELHSKWLKVKAELEGQYTLAASKRTLDVAFLEEKLREYEKALYRFSNVKDTVPTWALVKENLQAKEAAIEFVNFELFDAEWKDSTMLAAMVLLPELAAPRFIPLCYEEQLLNEMKKGGQEEDQLYVNRLYGGTRGSELLTKNSSTTVAVYQRVFQPLETMVRDSKKLYLSLSGSLHKISFAALPLSKDSLFLDRYDFDYISSTSLINPKKTAVSAARSIALFGGINYDTETVSAPVRTTASVRDRSINFNRSGQGVWHYLPGTRNETEMIYRLAAKSGWKPVLDSSWQASETRMKNMSGNAPSIIHIATHGYFFPDPEQKKNTNGGEEQNAFVSADNPLLRTGLILAGGNSTWKKGFTESGKEDGILTAYEVSNLNLSQSELVVLSACETGLGDIKGSEGVYGLQRAFKIAGANKLVMSLWQVPDKETAELMEAFYRHLFSGASYSDAFKKAQKTMRAKYPPFYWAAFVLIE